MRMCLFAVLSTLVISTEVPAAPCSEAGSLVRARTSAKGQHESVIFTFRKPTTVAYEVQAANPPFTEDPSDEPITVGGGKFTEVTFRNVSWMCEINEQFGLPRQVLVDVKRTSQFEGMVTYVIGRSASSHFIKVYSYDAGPGYLTVVVRYGR